MTTDYKNLCRLCAKKHEFSKNLFEECNKSIFKMIQDFTQIPINENDDLPKKICLNCEDKMVTFQMFVLECYKAQEELLLKYKEQELFKNKGEEEELKYQQCSDGVSVKSEVEDLDVKDNTTAEEIDIDTADVLDNQKLLSESSYLIFELNEEGHHNSHGDDYHDDHDEDHHDDDYGSNTNDEGDCKDELVEDEDDDEDELSIAALKKMKRKKIRQKKANLVDVKALNEILQKSYFKIREVIKYDCLLCDEKLKSWPTVRDHYVKVHKRKPVVFCLCGLEIRSHSQIYKHVSDHKEEIKRAKGEATEREKVNVDMKDYIKFVCHECGVKCSSWYSLRDHCEAHHDTTPIVQCSCGVTLKSKTAMYKHVHNHQDPKMVACDECHYIAKSQSVLNKHKMRHIPKSERKYCCSLCPKVFYTNEAKKSHEKSHIPVENRKLYSCEVCNLKFTTRSSAALHKRVVHDKIKSYVCDLCGYACGTHGELRQHAAIHSGDKPFICAKCSKTFKTYSNLKTHMDTHEDTAYECYVCRRVLNSKRTLRKHLLVHEDKCGHVCSYCNKAFKRRQTLKVHMYTHTGIKSLTCKWCDEKFGYASTLRAHRLRCHSDKMAAQAQDFTQSYSQQTGLQSNFMKNDLLSGSIPITKNEVEAM